MSTNLHEKRKKAFEKALAFEMKLESTMKGKDTEKQYRMWQIGNKLWKEVKTIEDLVKRNLKK